MSAYRAYLEHVWRTVSISGHRFDMLLEIIKTGRTIRP